MNFKLLAKMSYVLGENQLFFDKLNDQHRIFSIFFLKVTPVHKFHKNQEIKTAQVFRSGNFTFFFHLLFPISL